MATISLPDWAMATFLKTKLSYHRRLFLIFTLLVWTLVASFAIFQYGRERLFKVESLKLQLQLLNVELLSVVHTNGSLKAHIDANINNFDELKVALYDRHNGVLEGNIADTVAFRRYLSQNPAIAALRQSEDGELGQFTEHSEGRLCVMLSDDRYIVSSCTASDLTVREVIRSDGRFFAFLVLFALVMSILCFVIIRRLGKNIVHLRNFAKNAERGLPINDKEQFPADELGAISQHIIRLYARLQKTTADRDNEHAIALYEEREKIRIKKQLTHNINHELKTPVAAIKGYLETLQANPTIDSDKRAMFIDHSLQHIERLRQLLADISTITRMDEAKELILKERVALSEIVAEAVAGIEHKPIEQRLRVQIDSLEGIFIDGNAALLTSVFRNLVDNACAYSGGRDIAISIIENSDEEFTIRFSDNGIGIPEEHLPYIFERFYRIDTGRSRKAGGTGLGLAIVKNAVTIHSGTIYAQNGESGGLEFIITLPKINTTTIDL